MLDKQKKLLRKSVINTEDNNTELRRETKLYVTPKEIELWKMLGQNSVMLELLREDSYRDYTHWEFVDESSYQLTMEGNADVLFLDLLEYIS